MEESPSETHNYSGHPPTSQSRHPRTHPATRPPTLLPSLIDAALVSGMHAVLCSTIHPMSAFASNKALNASRDRWDSHALRLGPITHHLARLTAMLDPPPTHPLLLPPLSAPSLACCYPHHIPYSTCILSSLIYPYCRLWSGIYSLYCCMSCLQLSAAVCPLLSAVCRCLPLVYRCLPLLINKGHLPLQFGAAQIFGAARSL